jgi:plasmid stabilization system protein ParE
MSARLRFTPEAAAELREASAWHETQREGLGEAFVDALFGPLDRVRAPPHAFTLYAAVPGVRRALVQRFHFAFYYRPAPGEVLVVAVLHQRRSPKALTPRLRNVPTG